MTDSNTPPAPERTTARTAIDDVDRELIQLLKKRLDAVQRVGEAKARDPGTPLLDPAREAEICGSWAAEADRHGLSSYFTGRILREILNDSRRSQETLVHDTPESIQRCRLGFQGVPSCYGDLVITKLFGTRGQEPILAVQGRELW